MASLLCKNAALWWREQCEANRHPGTWEDLCRVLHEQFQLEDYSPLWERRAGRDATIWEKIRGLDFVFRFHTTCLKIQDLSKAQKLDRFICALVPEVRLQVELRGPLNFHEATYVC